MATLTRLSRKTLRAAPTLSVLSHHHHNHNPYLLRSLASACAAAVEQAPPKREILESPDRVKWDYRGQRKIVPLGLWTPKILPDAYVAPNCVLVGQVTVWDGASVWSGTVLRGDLNKISVGFFANVQERCVVHAAWTSPTGLPANTTIDRYVTVGADCLLRSCTIEPECVIGQHSIIMEGSIIESHSILEAGTVVPPGRLIPRGQLWSGNPARFVRHLTPTEIAEIPRVATAVRELSDKHFAQFLPYNAVYREVEKLKKQFGINV